LAIECHNHFSWEALARFLFCQNLIAQLNENDELSTVLKTISESIKSLAGQMMHLTRDSAPSPISPIVITIGLFTIN